MVVTAHPLRSVLRLLPGELTGLALELASGDERCMCAQTRGQQNLACVSFSHRHGKPGRDDFLVAHFPLRCDLVMQNMGCHTGQIVTADARG